MPHLSIEIFILPTLIIVLTKNKYTTCYFFFFLQGVVLKNQRTFSLVFIKQFITFKKVVDGYRSIDKSYDPKTEF